MDQVTSHTVFGEQALNSIRQHCHLGKGGNSTFLLKKLNKMLPHGISGGRNHGSGHSGQGGPIGGGNGGGAADGGDGFSWDATTELLGRCKSQDSDLLSSETHFYEQGVDIEVAVKSSGSEGLFFSTSSMAVSSGTESSGETGPSHESRSSSGASRYHSRPNSPQVTFIHEGGVRRLDTRSPTRKQLASDETSFDATPAPHTGFGYRSRPRPCWPSSVEPLHGADSVDPLGDTTRCCSYEDDAMSKATRQQHRLVCPILEMKRTRNMVFSIRQKECFCRRERVAPCQECQQLDLYSRSPDNTSFVIHSPSPWEDHDNRSPRQAGRGGGTCLDERRSFVTRSGNMELMPIIEEEVSS